MPTVEYGTLTREDIDTLPEGRRRLIKSEVEEFFANPDAFTVKVHPIMDWIETVELPSGVEIG